MPPFDSLTPEDVWDLVHYVQSLRVEAHEAELVASGLKEEDRTIAREKIWAVLSGRADVLKAVAAGKPRQTAASDMAQHGPGRKP